MSGYDVIIVGGGSAGWAHGLAGVRIADASIMPEIPSANTNLATIMVAERIASLVD